AEARARRDAGVGQLVARLDLGAGGGPRLDGRTDDVVEVVAPALALGQAGVAQPLLGADELAEALELVLAPDLHDEPAVLGLEPVDDERARALLAGAHRP